MNSPANAIDIADPSLHWFDAAVAPPSLGSAQIALLSDPGSLTQHLIEISDYSFRVELKEECWQTLAQGALRKTFGPVSSAHRFWSRKTVLLSDNEPVVLAHSLLPEHSLSSPLAEIPRLGVEPLGAFLFKQADLRRESFQLAESSAGYWGRRSMFFTASKPIMVAEFFYPGRKLNRLLMKIAGTKVSGMTIF
jgi:chorismate--pyruvate lyase